MFGVNTWKFPEHIPEKKLIKTFLPSWLPAHQQPSHPLVCENKTKLALALSRISSKCRDNPFTVGNLWKNMLQENKGSRNDM